MASAFCEVENCTRHGSIALSFPGEHGEQASRYPHKTLICSYHAQAAQEIFAAQGFVAPIEIKPPRRIPGGMVGERRRYTKPKPRDDADYDRRYGE